MRYLLIALMIALLPLRGWAGDAMAVDMAAQQMLVAQTSAANTAAMTTASGMPADCPMHLQAVNAKAADDNSDQAGTLETHCHSCDTCQLCLALSSWTHSVWSAGTMGRPALLLLAGYDFRSADAAASFKPPIS